MKKRVTAIVLSLVMMLGTFPAAGAYALESQTAQGRLDAGTDGQTADDGQVVVLYEEGEVDADTPATSTEKNKVKKARRSKTFGISSAGGDSQAVKQAENTLGQQSDILSDALGSNYTIEDTVVFNAEDKNTDDTVVSVVSSEKYSAEEMAEKLSANSRVRIAEPNYTFHMSAMPAWNDTYLSDAWQNTDKGINADKAWSSKDFDKASEPVVIAVMDTGIDYTHEELAGRMWIKPDTGDLGKLNGKYGVDFAYGDDDPMDENGHGTHCAGIIAAQADNNAGVAGVAGKSSKIQLMAVRILDEDGSGSLEGIVKGFRYLIRAKKAGANIKAVNCSFGASITSEIFDEVIELAGIEGILTIAAAGNETADNDQVPSSPANCTSKYVVSVAALDEDGKLASYSNYGRRAVDVAAPGSNIVSSVCYNNYAPYLYTADNVKTTSQYYSGFDGAALSGGSVTPVPGRAHDGSSVSGVGNLGTSVSLANRIAGSTGKAELSLTDPGAADAFPIGSNKTSLRWKITGAKTGDTYVLYFPYDKKATNGSNTYLNMVMRTHTEQDGGTGMLDFGDVVAYSDENGNVSYRTVSSDDYFGMSLTVTPDWNSIWQASGTNAVMYPRASIGEVRNDIVNGTGTAAGVQADASGASGDAVSATAASAEAAGAAGSGYGIGLVYNALTDGDAYVDISSIAISRVGADEEQFGKYDVYSGTSMATPVVTGSVGLIAAMNPDYSADQIRDTLYQSTRDGYADVCSTGGAVDFNYYETSSEAKPAISDAHVYFKDKLVTLYGSGMGKHPHIDARFNFRDETVSIDDSDITETSDDYVVFRDRHGLIGSEVTFTVTSEETGKTGQRTFFLVKGLASYKNLYTINRSQDDDFFLLFSKNLTARDVDEADLGISFPGSAKFLTGADKLVAYDDETVYTVEKIGKSYIPTQRGITLSEAIKAYAKKAAGKCELWKTDESDSSDEDAEAAYTIERIGEPAFMGNVVYELVKVDFVDRTAYILTGLDINGENDKWIVYYDSLADLGTAPAALNWRKLTDAALAGYKGKIYLLGTAFAGDDGESAASTMTFCCTPKTDGSTWSRSASMVGAAAGGRSIGQGGKLYYFFGRMDEGDIDYNIYEFNGNSWKQRGLLPAALASTDAGEVPELLLLFGIEPDAGGVKSALGIDSKGILFAGGSFDGGGDTFRFNTTTGKIQRLGYSLWGDAADRDTDGTVADGKLVVQYSIKDDTKVTAKYIKVKSGYVHLNKSIYGLGTGTVVGGGSVPEGEAVPVRITPAKGSYIREIHTTGLAKNFNKSYKKSTAKSRKTLTTTFKAKKDATISIEFGKVSTKMKVPKKQTVRVGKRRLKGSTNGTNSGVRWKSGNRKYAVVNKNGTVTFKKAGIGKKVRMTAISRENPKLKATTIVTIKAAKKSKKK